MKALSLNDIGAGVVDVQQRLVTLGILTDAQVSGTFDEDTQRGMQVFCQQLGMSFEGEVTEKIWSALVDESYQLGDRSLFLKMPYFHGNDVRQLQQALGALGFACGSEDAIFGAHTEAALRKFQFNMALDADGIAGANTYQAIQNLHHSWEGKPSLHIQTHLGLARVADVLGRHALCFFGTDDFSRNVASRISNLALATNPSSHIVSAESLLVAPDETMLLVHVVLPDNKLATRKNATQSASPVIYYDDAQALAARFEYAINRCSSSNKRRIIVVLPGATWNDAGQARSAQHYAIELLDAVCAALAAVEE